MTHHTLFVTWLNDALMMEEDVLKMLEGQVDQLESMPDQQQKIQAHAKTTQRQIERLEEALSMIDGDISKGKSFLGTILGSLSGPMVGLAKDKEVRDAVLAAATERFEIATYNKLLTAAEITGHQDVIPLLEESLAEEQAMETELEQDLPEVVERYIEMTPEEKDHN
jgi:ferritin-like metal-binding protein YciE